MGLLDDLAMGLGMKERTEDYDARTARTSAVRRAAADRGDATDAMYRAQAMNPDSQYYYGNYAPAMEAHDNYLFNVGGSTYAPQIADQSESSNALQNLLFSAPMSDDNPVSPRRLAVGPLDLQEPLSIPTPLSLVSKILGGFATATGGNDPLTSTAFDKYNEDDVAESLLGMPQSNFLSDWDLATMAAKANRDLGTGGVY
jgi:hypothetical protein